jgi:hypothetical protein
MEQDVNQLIDWAQFLPFLSHICKIALEHWFRIPFLSEQNSEE